MTKIHVCVVEVLREVGAVLVNYVPRDIIEDSSREVKHSGVSNLADRQSRPQLSLPSVLSGVRETLGRRLG